MLHTGRSGRKCAQACLECDSRAAVFEFRASFAVAKAGAGFPLSAGSRKACEAMGRAFRAVCARLLQVLPFGFVCGHLPVRADLLALYVRSDRAVRSGAWRLAWTKTPRPLPPAFRQTWIRPGSGEIGQMRVSANDRCNRNAWLRGRPLRGEVRS